MIINYTYVRKYINVEFNNKKIVTYNSYSKPKK